MNQWDKLYQEALSLSESGAEPSSVFELLTAAYSAGSKDAAYALATWYMHGEYVRRSIKKAVPLLKEAAEAGVIDAIFDLAICFEKGEGVDRDFSLAFSLYLNASLRGQKQAVFEVGRCYAEGIGTHKNRRLADVCFSIAEEFGTYCAEDV